MPPDPGSHASYQLSVGALLLVFGLALYAWTLWRPTARSGLARDCALLSLLGAACYSCAAWLYSPELAPRSQALLLHLRALPFAAAVAYVGRALARNQASKSPALERVCRIAPQVLLACWALPACLALALPHSALSIYELPPLRFALIKLRDPAELVVLAASAAVFAREALTGSAWRPTALRVQNLALFAGSLAFSLLVAVSLATGVIHLLDTPAYADSRLYSLGQPAQFALALCGGLCYLLGCFLYQSDEESRRILNRLRKWIRLRHDLELEFDRCGNLAGNRFTDRYLRHAASTLPSLRHSSQLIDRAVCLVKLLSQLDRPDGPSRDRISLLYRLQSDLSRTTDIASWLFVKIEGSAQYDLRNDALFNAATPALVLCQPNTPVDLTGEPEWIQLGAIAAADAGLLPAGKASELLDPEASAVDRTVLRAYLRAKEAEELWSMYQIY